ncbi:MAG: hypothetical protein V2I43_18215, partial [Parvularcula sp.]|nr:hypothetical protein [Parvularcula sp.]
RPFAADANCEMLCRTLLSKALLPGRSPHASTHRAFGVDATRMLHHLRHPANNLEACRLAVVQTFASPY